MRLSCILFPLIATAALIPASAAPQSEATPESTVRTFLSAIEAADLKAAAACVLDAKIDSSFDSFANLLRKQALRFEISGFKATEQGDECTATFDAAVLQGTDKQELKGQVLKLRKVEGRWKLLSGPWPTQGEPDKTTQIETLVTILAHPGSMEIARESAVATACMSNLKQLSLAVIMFMADNNDKYLLSTTKLQAKLTPYTRNKELFHCPDKQHPDRYSFNDRLTSRRDVDVQSPATTVLLYEGANEKLVYRHNGRAAVAFADGHVKLVKPEDAKSLVWKP